MSGTGNALQLSTDDVPELEAPELEAPELVVPVLPTPEAAELFAASDPGAPLAIPAEEPVPARAPALAASGVSAVDPVAAPLEPASSAALPESAADGAGTLPPQPLEKTANIKLVVHTFFKGSLRSDVFRKPHANDHFFEGLNNARRFCLFASAAVRISRDVLSRVLRCGPHPIAR
jgi:hypothetical protein